MPDAGQPPYPLWLIPAESQLDFRQWRSAALPSTDRPCHPAQGARPGLAPGRGEGLWVEPPEEGAGGTMCGPTKRLLQDILQLR